MERYNRDEIKSAIWQELKEHEYTGENNDRAYEIIGIVMAGLDKIVSGTQTGAVWVKASECLPKFDGLVHLKIDGLKKIGNFYHEEGKNKLYVNGPEPFILYEDKFGGVEWLDDSGTPVADWAKDYDTLYYIVMPVLNKLRHRTDNDTRMMERGSEIRDTIHKVLADIKKLPPPISSNEPPFLVQSDVTPAAAREEDANRCSVFVPCTEDDPDCCGGYTSMDGRSLCYVKEISVPTSNNDQIIAALRKFVSMHETGLLPNRVVYEEGKKALESLGTNNDAIEFGEFLRKNNMSPDGFGGWSGDINTNLHGSTTAELYLVWRSR